MKNKYIKFIVKAYITVNILGTIVYYTMPKGGFVQAKAGVDSKQVHNRGNEVMNNPQVLADKSLADKYNVKSYNFNYEVKDLEISIAKEQHQIFIDRKTSDDNKVEVFWYPGYITVDSIDFTNVLKEPNIKLFNNKLNIEYKNQKYSFTQFSKDPVINQFYDKKNNESNKGISGFGGSILYIRIPKNLKVLGDEGYQYINN